ncbi:hypothetical protein DQW77_17190 [Roseovarius sp. TE539]|uniref:isochorismatase family protein n=1 Tax=Roseovarius sp. TE539 TaxID=2249812 RepID=UPI000DDD54A3|nr:isochorismatase family protein [Roseovarius sp. TE539]RBI67853.1 hypothetical protein DQW77_17190 [Roseovarius sp. TE539]
MPTFLTTSFEHGPNGPIVLKLKETFPDAPFIARPGQINAWDNEDFLAAVSATGKTQLIVAGVVTEVCVAFPVLSAIEEAVNRHAKVTHLGGYDHLKLTHLHC